MGNCWPKPVDLPTSNNPRPPTPAPNIDTTVIIGLRNHHHEPPPEHGSRRGDQAALPPSVQIMTPNLKIFTLAELRGATNNFRPDTVLGEGGFGRVFKGYVDEKTLAPSTVGEGIPVAVKKSNPDSAQGLKEWQAAVKFSHPNLVKLLGYCWEDRQFLLVYEYMPSSEDQNSNRAARGLVTEKTVIYRDFKASYILLDTEFNAKLSDFGLAKLGPVDGNSQVVGTYG